MLTVSCSGAPRILRTLPSAPWPPRSCGMATAARPAVVCWAANSDEPYAGLLSAVIGVVPAVVEAAQSATISQSWRDLLESGVSAAREPSTLQFSPLSVIHQGDMCAQCNTRRRLYSQPGRNWRLRDRCYKSHAHRERSPSRHPQAGRRRRRRADPKPRNFGNSVPIQTRSGSCSAVIVIDGTKLTRTYESELAPLDDGQPGGPLSAFRRHLEQGS